MTVLITQLGDIHLRTSRDEVTGCAEHIGAAIAAELDSETNTVVLAFCGDITYSGTAEQFQVASGYVDRVYSDLQKRVSPDTQIIRIAIPGNHDCDFSGDLGDRDKLLVDVSGSDTVPPQLRELLVEPLNEYFAFAERSIGSATAICRESPFYLAVDVPDHNSVLRVHLLNTAWTSSKKEQPGSLRFPLGELSPPNSQAGCSIAILHHPINWFAQPHVMRQLRDRLNELASVVLFNHEHVSEAAEITPLATAPSDPTSTVYVHGGALQDGATCSFNTLKISVARRSLAIVRHSRLSQQGQTYFERTELSSVDLMHCQTTVGPAGVSLNKDWAAVLNDPGTPIYHPHRDPRIGVHLDEIFLYPDMWELDSDHEGADQRQVKSADVLLEVLGSKRVLITGEEKSGRTAIAKRLFSDAFNAGKVPVMLFGSELPKSTELLRRKVRDAVADQYLNLPPDAFEQLRKLDRVVILDDIHKAASDASTRSRLLSELERQFGTVILCGDDIIRMDSLGGKDVRHSGLWEYRHLVILGFGEYLREEFVRQWLMLDRGSDPEDRQLEAEVERVCALVNIVLKKQLLPSYPLFLLLLLQQSDLASTSAQSGSFGKLFEGLTTALLSKSDYPRLNIGDKHHYMAALAKQMYDTKSMSLSVEDARKWHRTYWDQIELDIDYDRLIEDLGDVGLLVSRNSEVRFKYVYFFCYFVAYHLNRTIHTPQTRELIKWLAGQLHHRVSAEVMLFLAHMTGDPVVLDEMVGTCDRLFVDVVPATLREDTDPLDHISELSNTIEIPDCPDENRRELRLRNDEHISERLTATTSIHAVIPPQAEDESTRRLFDITAAYKTIQILGQALRNIAGSTSKTRKEEVLGKIVGLSTRMLGVYIASLSETQLPHVVEEMASMHRDQQPELVASDIHAEVCRQLHGISRFVCFSVVKHTTFSVGSENLDPTIHRILSDAPTPLLQTLDLSFRLERPGRFPKEAALKLYQQFDRYSFAANLVRTLVAHHMYLYVVPIHDRQAVCDKMLIKLNPVVMDRDRKRIGR